MQTIEVDAPATALRPSTRALVGAAVNRSALLTREGMSERLFTLAFSGLVYPQIWEDPVVDLEAMELAPGQHVVAIASGGCNVLSYLTAAPVTITGVDLNSAHVALNNLKYAAVRHLGYDDLHLLFANAASPRNVRNFDTKLAPHLDAATLRYWNGRDRRGRRRINVFARGFYRTGLLGRFIASGHGVAHMLGGNPAALGRASTLDEQRALFEREIRPLFKKKILRKILNQRASLFGLGIPPAQYHALSEGRPMHEVIEARLERLACGFDLKDNYFAWQAFNRGYAAHGEGPLPPYLQSEHFETLRARIADVRILNISLTAHLATLPDASVDRFVLLDAQDWMNDPELTALWHEITRTARDDARVIFRTAGVRTILPGRIPFDILRRWEYREELSKALAARDRSAIYGGFHRYTKGA